MSTIETDLEHDLAERVAQIGRKSRDARSAESTSAIELNLALRKLRHVDGLRNMGYLAVDYLTILAVFAAGAIFLEYRASWGLPRWTNILMFGLG